MTTPAISVEGLRKTFPAASGLARLLARSTSRRGTEALRGITLEVLQGEVLGLLGPNGSGKTTLLEILATFLLPDEGQASVFGRDVVGAASHVRALVGYAPASPSFYPTLSGTVNLEFFAILNDLPPRQTKSRVSALLELVGLDGSARKPFQQYSDGMKQRLSLARALLADPPVLLLDEPTRGLDPLLQIEFRRFLRDTLVGRLGKTVLLVTHSLAEAAEVCDRVAILCNGAIVAIGDIGQVQQALGAEDLASAFRSAAVGPS